MKTLSAETVATVLDLIYQNATRTDQKTLGELAKQANISYQPFRKIVSCLENLQLLFLEGNKHKTFRWNKDKAGVNPSMVRKVHETYTGTTCTKEPKLTVEKAIAYLSAHDWHGTLTRTYQDGLITHTETINA